MSLTILRTLKVTSRLPEVPARGVTCKGWSGHGSITQPPLVHEATKLQKDATTLQKAAIKLQKVATALQKSANNLQKVATILQKAATTLQKDATTLQKVATKLQKAAIKLQKDATSLQKAATTLYKAATKLQKEANRSTLSVRSQAPKRTAHRLRLFETPPPPEAQAGPGGTFSAISCSAISTSKAF